MRDGAAGTTAEQVLTGHRPPWASSILLAALAGGAIWELWLRLGLPDRGGPLDAPFPGLWRWFFAVCFPLLFPAFTVAHARLVRLAEAGAIERAVARRGAAWDRSSRLLLLLVPLALVVWHRSPHWRVASSTVT